MALPNSRILIHQVSGGFQGQGTDIEIQAREVIGLKRRLEEIYAEHTDKPIEEISRDMERDFFMSPVEAKEYGIIDTVITHRDMQRVRRPRPSRFGRFGVERDTPWRVRAKATSSFSAASAGSRSGRSRS